MKAEVEAPVVAALVVVQEVETVEAPEALVEVDLEALAPAEEETVEAVEAVEAEAVVAEAVVEAAVAVLSVCGPKLETVMPVTMKSLPKRETSRLVIRRSHPKEANPWKPPRTEDRSRTFLTSLKSSELTTTSFS
jgi:hypothetical protein